MSLMDHANKRPIEKSRDSPNKYPYVRPSSEDQGGEIRKRKRQSRKLNKPVLADDGFQEMDSAYLTPPSGNVSRERSPNRSQSLPRYSSIPFEHPYDTSTEPEQKIFRKDTASWFKQGKVFEVSRDTSPTITNAGVSECPLWVVIYRRDASITCLPLRRHHFGVAPRDFDLLKSRIRIYARVQQTGDILPECPCRPLPIDPESDADSLDDMWINIEEPHRIENVQHVKVALWGVLDDASFDTLSEAYLSAQLRNVTSPREYQGTLLWHLQFLFRCIWQGVLWAFQR